MPSWAPRPGRRGPQAGQPNSHPGADIRVSPNPFCRQLPRYWSAWRKARGRNTSQPGCPLGRLGSCWIQVKRKLGRSHQTGLACSTAGTNLRRQLMGPCHGWPIGTIADGSLIVKALILRTSTHWRPLANAQAAADCITASPPKTPSMRSKPTRPNQQPGHPIVARSWSSATGQAFAWAGCIENTNKTISQTGDRP